jgi:5'-methylthioadenosine phosphorylase
MIGIFGGSGFYSLLDQVEIIERETPFGMPSSPVTIGVIGRREVAFIARHGLRHEYPPHMIPYKANLYAFRELGVTRVLAPAAVGSLKREIKPGDFVISDQFVNFTNREDTFYNEMPVTHVSAADPYCPELRNLIIKMGRTLQLPMHERGTVVVVNGPRFASRAESAFYQSNGWDTINMTQYPEMILAREMEMCYANISLVTDYDTGVKDDQSIAPVSAGEVAHVFAQNIQKMKRLIFDCIPNISDKRECSCGHALDKARFQ